MTMCRVFLTQAEADQHRAGLPGGSHYLKRSRAVIANPGRAYQRLTARGVLTQTPIETLRLRDGTFGVPVPRVATTLAVRDATGILFVDGSDPLAGDTRDRLREADGGEADAERVR